MAGGSGSLHRHRRGLDRPRRIERRDDVFDPAGPGKPHHGRLVFQHVGQLGQYADMLVGAGGDADDQIDDLAGVPFDPMRNLKHGKAGLLDQLPVLGKPVGDCDAITQICRGDLFPLHHAVYVTGMYVAAFDQNDSRLMDRVRLVHGVCGNTHIFRSQTDHTAFLFGN